MTSTDIMGVYPDNDMLVKKLAFMLILLKMYLMDWIDGLKVALGS